MSSMNDSNSGEENNEMEISSPKSPPNSRSSPHSRSRSKSQSQSRSPSPSKSQSHSRSQSPETHSRSQSKSPSRSRSQSKSPSRSRSGSKSPSHLKAGSKSPSSSRSRSRSPQSEHSVSQNSNPSSPPNPSSPQSNASQRSGSSPRVATSPIRSPDPPSSPVEQKAHSPHSPNEQESEGEVPQQEVFDAEQERGSEEENIPEVNIESEEEKNSDHDVAQSGDEEEKEDNDSVHVESDADNKSDDEELQRKTPPSSPLQKEEKVDQSDNEDEVPHKKKEDEGVSKENDDSESDADSEESEVGGLIADIFGESDEEEEFEGFKVDDIEPGKQPIEATSTPKKEKKKRAQIMSDSEDEKEEADEKANEAKEEMSGEVEAMPQELLGMAEQKSDNKKKLESDDSDDDMDRKMREDFVSDFELMMQRKKEESSKRRKRRDVDLISDSDDLIADIISQMRQAADDDKDLNKQKKTATKKLKILPMVMSQLKKQDLKMAFIDQGVLNVIAEWLTPLPDRSLPHLNIREGMIKQLSDLPSFDQHLLKSSGIGRAVMYLFKHPRETKENRERAGKLITEWARPIFNVTTNYHSLTKEEREQRDYDHVPKKRRTDRSEEAEEEPKERKDMEKELTGETTGKIKPGEKGWIGRARVPMPSNKDYVNRPKWNVEMEFGRGPSKKPLSRLEKHMRMLQDKKRSGKQERAVTISIEGRKMAI